jgi:hypothetical protein
LVLAVAVVPGRKGHPAMSFAAVAVAVAAEPRGGRLLQLNLRVLLLSPWVLQAQAARLSLRRARMDRWVASGHLLPLVLFVLLWLEIQEQAELLGRVLVPARAGMALQ